MSSGFFFPNCSLNLSELKHLLPPLKQPFSMLPAHRSDVSPCRAFSLGLLPHPLFLVPQHDSGLHTQVACAWIYSKRVRIHVASSLPSPYANAWTYQSCDVDLIIHVCLEGNKKACVRLCSYFNDHPVWINYTSWCFLKNLWLVMWDLIL